MTKVVVRHLHFLSRDLTHQRHLASGGMRESVGGKLKMKSATFRIAMEVFPQVSARSDQAFRTSQHLSTAYR